MRRILLSHYSGPIADDLAVARRLARKLHGAHRQGECVLLDCDQVLVSKSFLEVLVNEARRDKVRFCGLPQSDQRLIQKLFGAKDWKSGRPPKKT
jgi:hypothetical protein